MATITTRRAFLAASLPVVAAAALAAPALSVPATQHPDADILELGRQRLAVIAALDRGGVGDDESNRLGDEWLALDHRIMEATPQTAAGIAVQLAVIWRDMDVLPGEENGPTENTSRATRWLWTAMQNASRIGAA